MREDSETETDEREREKEGEEREEGGCKQVRREAMRETKGKEGHLTSIRSTCTSLKTCRLSSRDEEKHAIANYYTQKH